MKKYQYSPAEMALIENTIIPLAVYQFIDKRVVTIVLSEGFCKLLGLQRDEAYFLMDHDMYRDTHPDDAARVADASFRFATEGGEYNVAYRTKVKGKYRILHARGEHVYPEPGVRLAIVWYTDEGEYLPDSKEHNGFLNQAFNRVLQEETLYRKNFYDSLTGLPNLPGFLEFAEPRRGILLKENKQPAIVFINVNGMKFYNRKFGFNEGDKLLRNVAKTLAAHFGNENCGRFGMDVFAVITAAQDLELNLNKIFNEIGQFRDENGFSIRAGVAIDPDGSEDLSEICDKAKYACDVNRGTFSPRISYFNETMLADVEKRQYIIDNFDRAIREKWIQVYYQPIIRAANDRVCDEEALARWIDPVKGLLVPSDFIATLEDSNLIYKLDLYIVEEVLRKMRLQAERGLNIVPISINFSRTDFDACDLVSEVCRRVDEAGLPREKLTIEITESVVGKDFVYIKSQVERFRSLGFKVWMDDFGSGYSSLDVLQSIRFDLIKFDMRFMQQFDYRDESRVILTELMKMAVGLGIDTLAEGVERQDQVDFLKEVGCTKLQGYYYCQPIPMQKIFERYEKGISIGFENLEETEYYSALGRVNLYDTGLIAQEDQESFRNYFDTLPMAVIESSGDQFRLIRCNRSFREFEELMDWSVPLGKDFLYNNVVNRPGLVFMKFVRQCSEKGNRLIIDDVMPNGTAVHAFLKRIAVNPVSGTAAVAIVVLGVFDEKSQKSPLTYANIAQVLSSDYFDLFYVNLKTEDYVHYKTDVGHDNIAVERHGKNFFAEAYKDADNILYAKDREFFIKSFTKKNVIKAIDKHSSFTLTYRQIYKGKPVYVNLKAARMSENADYVIIGVSNVDAQMKQQKALEQARQERITYSRITALTGDIICIYTVDPVTENYKEYNASSDYEELGLAKEGVDFFTRARKEALHAICPDDLDRFLEHFNKENVLEEIKKNQIYGLRYRLMIEGEPKYVSLKAGMVEENGGPQLVIGVHNIDARIRRDQEYEKNIAIAKARINLDSLTGVKNRHAFEAVVEQINEQINGRHFVEFSVSVFGMRKMLNLKTPSSQEEDTRWIKEAAETICEVFKRSPVFRLGDDEFVVISQGQDYAYIDDLIKRFENHNEKMAAVDGIIIPMGMAVYDRDLDVASVYQRAVENMKENYNAFRTVWSYRDRLFSRAFTELHNQEKR